MPPQLKLMAQVAHTTPMIIICQKKIHNREEGEERRTTITNYMHLP